MRKLSFRCLGVVLCDEVVMWERLHLGAQTFISQGNHTMAENHFRQALTEAEKELGPNDNRIATILNNFANMLRMQGRLTEAEPLYQRALSVRRKALGALHSDEVVILENYAKLLRQMGREKEAGKMEQTAMGIMRRG